LPRDIGGSVNSQQRDEPRYQHLKKIADLLDWAGDLAGAEFTDESREAYSLARKFHDRADLLGTAGSKIHRPD
jgi:hypothetical protein